MCKELTICTICGYNFTTNLISKYIVERPKSVTMIPEGPEYIELYICRPCYYNLWVESSTKAINHIIEDRTYIDRTLYGSSGYYIKEQVSAETVRNYINAVQYIKFFELLERNKNINLENLIVDINSLNIQEELDGRIQELFRL